MAKVRIEAPSWPFQIGREYLNAQSQGLISSSLEWQTKMNRKVQTFDCSVRLIREVIVPHWNSANEL
jgi:hypothetical protein